ncbi:hypothetical protein BH11BAC7_BH11BAC7_33770 [soil metagenome]
MDLPRMNNPCPQDYEKMTPAENGRFCSNCCKVVVDFTKKKAEEIFDYLKSHSGTCGRFNISQLQPAPVSSGQKFSMRLKRFSLALYLVFGGLLFSTTACGGQVDYYDSLDDSIQNAQFNIQQKHLQDSLEQDSIKRDSLIKPD